MLVWLRFFFFWRSQLYACRVAYVWNVLLSMYPAGRKASSGVLSFLRGAGVSREPSPKLARKGECIDSVRYTPRMDWDSLEGILLHCVNTHSQFSAALILPQQICPSFPILGNWTHLCCVCAVFVSQMSQRTVIVCGPLHFFLSMVILHTWKVSVCMACRISLQWYRLWGNKTSAGV